jgi:DNA-binding XRE family transcriptional regulator
MDWSYIAGYFDGEGHVHFKAAPSRPDYILISLSWANTHKRSLEAIKEFIGCGILNPATKKEGYKLGYCLAITRVADILRVGEAMLPYLLIKQQELQEMMEWAKVHRTAQKETWGILGRVGAEEITRLYHVEGLTQRQIAEKIGVSDGAVASFFLRHGINGRRRGPAEGAYGILAEYGYEKLHAQFENGMTIAEIAKEAGAHYRTVYMHFFTRGIRLTKRIRRARAVRNNPILLEETPLLETPLFPDGIIIDSVKTPVSRKGIPKSPETIARMKTTRQKMWEDPEYAARQRVQLALGAKAPRSKGYTNPSIQGEKHPRSKLSDASTEEIRQRYAAGGIGLQGLADEYHVSKKTILNIVHYKIRTATQGSGDIKTIA